MWLNRHKQEAGCVFIGGFKTAMPTSRCASSCLLSAVMLCLSQAAFGIDTIDTPTPTPLEQILLKLSDPPGVNMRPALNSSPTSELNGTQRVDSSGRIHADTAQKQALEVKESSGSRFNQQVLGVGYGHATAAAATANKISWPELTPPNTNILSIAGVGFNWIDDGNLVVKINYAFKPSGQATISAPNNTNRLWLQAFIYF